MKRKIVLLMILMIVCSCSGCKNPIYGRTEIDHIEFIRGVGIDKTTGILDRVKLTTTSKTGKPDGAKLADELSMEGDTMFDAVRNFSTYSDKKLFWGHSEYYIFGENTAKSGILKYLDFLSRDHELRLTAKVLIVKGKEAREVLCKGTTSESFVVDRLTSIFNDAGAKSISGEVQLVDAMQMFDSETGSTYLPYIELAEIAKREKEDADKVDLVLKGYAVFKGSKLFGFLSERQSRGLNWTLDKVQTGIIVVKGITGGKTSLEIIDTDAKIVPKFEKDKLSVAIEVNMSSNLGEMQSPKEEINEDLLKLLAKEQNQFIKAEINSAVEYAQTNNLDFLGIGDAVFHKYPVKWEKLKNSWKTEFSKVKISINVQSKINRTYSISDPTGKKADE